MTAKEYLSRYLAANREIDALLDQRQQLWDKVTRVTATISPDTVMGGQPTPSSDIIAKLLDIESEINRKIDLLVDIKRDIEDVINALADDRQRDVLRLRYINGYTWERIAVESHYSYQWVCKLHGYALANIAKILDRN